MSNSLRLDTSPLKIDSKVKRTPQGGILANAYLTRIGVFEYKREDGSITRELRHPDHVFDEDSLATLAHAPLTIGHPGLVRADNYKALTVGHVADVIPKKRYVAAEVRIQDAETVTKVDAGDLIELSCGYECEVVQQSGAYDGEEYDAVQTNIRYNHVGLGPKGWGRAGGEVKLRIDGAAYAIGMPVERKDAEAPKTEPATEKKDTQEIPAAPPAAPPSDPPPPSVASPETIDEIKAIRDMLKARVAELEARLTPAALDSALEARVALREKARKVVGDGVDFAGKTDREVKVAAIKATRSDFNDDGKSDAYVDGAFEYAVDASTKSAAALGKLNQDAASAKPPVDSVEEARKQMIERHMALNGKSK